MIYSNLLQPLLFSLDAEQAHHLALRGAELLASSRELSDAIRIMARPGSHPVETLGLSFPNPVGLAGGMDKNAVAPLAWWAFGFGFIELGTVTPRPQPGNERPRMFRLPKRHALINRMGFNNDGAEQVLARLGEQLSEGRRPPFPIGISVGKNKDTPADQAAEDFATAASLLAPYANFLTINVSSPNTPGLRALQSAEELRKLVRAVRSVSGAKPILVKIAPELDGEDLRASLDAALSAGARGVIATNTLSTTAPTGEPAGLSGRPLREIALRKVEAIRRDLGDGPTLIGCGGVEDAASAQAMLDAGANLVQLYTALVYHGPFLPVFISRGLRHHHDPDAPTESV
jgi:dihydroorotate dehydrogenase